MSSSPIVDALDKSTVLNQSGLQVSLLANETSIEVTAGPKGKTISVRCCGLYLRIPLTIAAASHLASLLNQQADLLPEKVG